MRFFHLSHCFTAVLAFLSVWNIHAEVFLLNATSVWPHPNGNFMTGKDTLIVSNSLQFVCASSDVCPDVLQAAFPRYKKLIFPAGTPSHIISKSSLENVKGTINKVVVYVKQQVQLSFGVDESYSLAISENGLCNIKAETQWGALRALETFSQLVWWDASRTQETVYYIRSVPISISDTPRFPWRGMLLDSSRHFLPKRTIFHILDALSYVKYNTIHWHLTDDQSWPIQSTLFPNFTKAAYRPELVYTHQDVQDIVHYAYERGIRVIPEIDMPAHADAWGIAYPELVIQCDGHQTLLDPTDTDHFNVYYVFDQLLSEYSPLFNTSGGFFHIGGDEVSDMTCWQQSNKVQNWMKKYGLSTVKDVRQYFETRIQQVVQEHNQHAIVWEEVYTDGYKIDASTSINAWNSDVVSEATAAGYSLIYNYGWYLDQQTPPGGSHYLWEDTWTNFWLNEPFPEGLSPAQQKLVLGGEASQWGEQFDAINKDSRMWPRGCGAAERLWSAQTYNDITVAWPRLAAMQCRLAQRGIGAGPVRPSADYGYCPLPPNSPFLA